MLLSVFESSLFLQSLGWGIANSLWQAGVLWMVYILITAGNKTLPASFRHNLSLILLFVSFAWFIITVIQNYLLAQYKDSSIATAGWMYISANIHTALQWLSILYIGLLIPYCMQFIRRLSGLYIIHKTGLTKAPAGTRIFTAQKALHIGIKRKVAVWLSDNVKVPSVIGLLKPVILLPAAMLNQLTTEQAESIILHELAHIKRNDYLLNLIQSFTELVLFFNPFIRLLGNIARTERENCCDDWVLNYQYDKHEYAAALCMLERQRTTPVTFNMAATNGKKNLLLRIKRLFITTPQRKIDLPQQIKLLCTGALLLLVSFFLLPIFGKKAGTDKPAIMKYAFLQSQASPDVTENYKELQSLKIRNDKPSQVAIMNTKTKAHRKHIKISRDEWVSSSTTLINEDLLKAGKNQSMPLLAGHTQSTSYPLLVKVEEERSGVKGKNTYLLQLSNKNGIAEIKPLVYVNKKMKLKHGKIKITVPGKLSGKKRITS